MSSTEHLSLHPTNFGHSVANPNRFSLPLFATSCAKGLAGYFAVIFIQTITGKFEKKTVDLMTPTASKSVAARLVSMHFQKAKPYKKISFPTERIPKYDVIATDYNESATT